MILCEGVKFGILSLTGSKFTHEVIYLFKQTIKQTKTTRHHPTCHYVENQGKLIIQSRVKWPKTSIWAFFFDDFKVK